MTNKFPDPRRNVYRDDLAAKELEGVVRAGKFVEGELNQIVAPSAGIRTKPHKQAPLASEALFGEKVRVFEKTSEWSWGQLQRDGYVGYLETADLSHELTDFTHRVSVLRTFVFSLPDIKSRPVFALSLNSKIKATDEEQKFVRIGKSGFIYRRHLSLAGEAERDYVSVADKFCGTPYLWGGSQFLGIDCSGLVQMSMLAAGLKAPRDSDMQEEELGFILKGAGVRQSLKRGDLIFWRGHVGIMCNSEDITHANAFHMMTITEPLDQAIQRIQRAGEQVSSFKRLSEYREIHQSDVNSCQ